MSSISFARSKTIIRALEQFYDYAPSVHPVDLVYEILALHEDYVPHKYHETFALVAAQKDLTSLSSEKNENRSHEDGSNLLYQVESLYDVERVRKLYGRNVIIGLALLDENLFELLSKNGFLKDLEKEINEPLNEILSERGAELYKQRMAKAEIKQERPYTNDNVNNQTDAELKEQADDRLNRFEFAGFLVKLLNQVDLSKGSFSMHLYAPWGAGKSSVLNFMRLQMKRDRRKWQTVYFNAWQNQTLSPPWWSLMHVIYNSVKPKLSWRYRIDEFFWRFRLTGFNYVIAFLSFAVVMYAVFVYRKSQSDLETIVKVVTGVIAIITLMFTSVKGMFRNSEKAAESYLNSKNDPMKAFKQRFTKLVQKIQTPLAIFIDDLDRCKSGYVVDLLENVQTLFKESNVVFVVAADKRWIHAAYEVEYCHIKPHVGREGKSLGPLFVEKMFQLSVALPGVAKEIKQHLWNTMLGDESAIELTTKDETINDLSIGTVEEREKAIRRANKKTFRNNHSDRLAILERSADTVVLEKTEHFLKGYADLLDLNPRSMKGLLNNYTVNKASCLLSHIDIEPHQLILWTILCMRWPILADHMINCSQENLIRKETPPEISTLLQNCDVKNLLAGGGKEPLSWNTLDRCRQLFT